MIPSTVVPGYGRLPKIATLTRAGAAAVARMRCVDMDEIRYTPRVRPFARDFFHRSDTVDIHIAFRTWARERGIEIREYRHYFDRSAAGLADTRLEI